MPRRPNPRKVALWRDRLERFSSSDQSVAHFCSAEGVSSWSFYKWRKRLAQDSPATSAADPRPAAFREVQMIASVPGVSIHLPSGARIEIGGDQLDTVRAVVGELVGADAPGGRAASC